MTHSHYYTLRQLYGRRLIEGEADSFIYGNAYQPVRIILRVIAQTIRDWKTDIQEGSLSDLPLAPIRRCVDAGYFKGAHHRLKRTKEGTTDISHGQNVVLDRHVSQR